MAQQPFNIDRERDRERRELNVKVGELTDGQFELNPKDPSAQDRFKSSFSSFLTRQNVELSQMGFEAGLNPAFLSPAQGESLEETNERIKAEIEAVSQIPQQINPNPIRPFTPLIDPELAREFGAGLPVVGPAAGPVLGAAAELTTPVDIAATIATAGVGPSIARGIAGRGAAIPLGRLGAPTIGDIAAAPLAPIVRGGFGRRVAAEAGVGVGAVLGAQELPAILPDQPGPLEAIEGGLLGGLAAVAAPGAARGVVRGVTRGLDEAAFQLQGRPKAFAAEPEGRIVTPEELSGARTATEQQAGLPAPALTADTIPIADINAAVRQSRQFDPASLPVRRSIEVDQAADEVFTRIVNKMEDLTSLARTFTRTEINKIRSIEKKRKTAKAIGAARGQDPLEAGARGTGALVGEEFDPRFEAIRDRFNDDELRVLYDKIGLNRITESDGPVFFTRLNTDAALSKALGGQVPTPSELDLLANVFGQRFAEVLRGRRGAGAKALETSLDILGIPKTLRSTLDVSGFARQGGLLAVRRRKEFKDSAREAFKAMFSEEAALEIDAAMRADPIFDFLINRGLTGTNLEITDISSSGFRGLGIREEAYTSKYLNQLGKLSIPVRASERHYVTFLNNLRYRTVKNTLIKWQDAGIPITDQAVDSLIGWVNVATGRGSLVPTAIKVRGKTIQVAGPLNAIFWAPKLVSSRFEALGQSINAASRLGLDTAGLIHLDPASRAVSKEIAADMTAFVGTGLAILGMFGAAKAANIPPFNQITSIETDPRSSDFGKIQVGATRIEFWAGFQPLARYTAQGITGQRKTLREKDITNVDFFNTSTNRFERAATGLLPTMSRFLRSKLAPGVAALASNELFGSTFIGDKLNEPSPVFDAADNTFLPDIKVSTRLNEAIQQFVPLILKDIDESIGEQGLRGGAIFALPAAVGFGVQTIPEEAETGRAAR